MNSFSIRLLLTALIAVSSQPLQAQSTWTDGGPVLTHQSWSAATNWSPSGVPGISGGTAPAIIISGLLPTSDTLIVLDTGTQISLADSVVTIGSLTFNNTGNLLLGDDGATTLTVNGPITNTTTAAQTISAQVTAGANALYAGGPAGGSLTFSGSLIVGTSAITTSGTVNVSGNLSFTINKAAPGANPITFGTIGPITATGAVIKIDPNGTYITNATLVSDTGDFFQLTTGSGNFSGATLTTPPAFTDTGLTWVTSLIKKGILVVQPTAGGNLINSGVVLPIGNDTEFNPIGSAGADVTFNGGELLTSDNGALDTGGTLGTAFSTTKLYAVNTTGGTIAATTGTTATYGGIISNGNGATGVLTIGDTTNKGTVVFTGQNTYGNGTSAVATVISTNTTLQIGNGGTSGRPGTGNILNNGSLVLDRSDAITDNGIVVSGTGNVVQEGLGTFTVTANDTYTGTTSITAGTLQVNGSLVAGSTVGVGTAGTLSGAGTVNGNATLTGNGIVNFTNPGKISGTLAVTGGNWNGAGSVTGLVTSSSGILNIGSGANLTATAGVNVTGGTISSTDSTGTITGNVNYTSASGTGSTFNGVIAGAGKTLTMNSAGKTLILGGNNTYTGATTVTAGALQVNGSTATGSAVSVASGATLSGTNGTVGGAATVTGGTVNGNNLTFTTGITFNSGGGTGILSGTETGAVTVAAGASVAQSGVLTGNVSLANGASTTFSGSGTVGTVTMNGGGDTLTGNATLTTSGVTVNGSTNTLTGTVTGAITQNASSALTVTGAAGSDTMANAATLSGIGTVGAVTLAGNNIISSTGTLTTGGITVSGAGNTIGTGTITGAITQNASSALSVTGTAGSDTMANAATLNGTGTVGTVSLAGSNTVSSTGTLTTSGITVSGAGNTIGTGTITGAITQNASSALAVTGTVTGADSLAAGATTLSGSGTVGGAVTMNGGNTLNGSGLTVNSLVINNTGNTLSGTETATNGVTIAGASSVTQTGGTLTGSVSDTSSVGSTFNGAIAGAGKTVTLNNANGTLTLTGANTYTGATTVTAGTLILGGTGSLGNTAVSIASGATLSTAVGATTNSIGGAITDSSGTINLQNNGINTLSGTTLSGNGTLSIDIGSPGNSDRIALTGTESLSAGAFTVNVDSLTGATVGTAYTFFSAAGGLSTADFTMGTLSGTLAGDTFTFSGTGTAITLTINAANGYFYTGAADTVFTNLANYSTAATGGTTPVNAIDATTNIFIGATTPAPPANPTPALNTNVTINSLTFTPSGSGGGLSGTGTLTTMNGITVQGGVAGTETIGVAVALGANQTWTVTDLTSTLLDQGGISGAFGLTKAGLGTLTLGAADAYTGPTVVSAGALKITNNASLGGTSSVTVANGAALQLAGGITTTTAVPTTLSGSGISGNGALENFSGNNTYTGLITLASNTTIGSDSGTLNLTNTGTITGNGFGLTLTGAGNGNLASVIGTGSGTLTKSGTGIWTLTGTNTFTGATTITGGTLALGTGGSLATSNGVNLSGATAIFDTSAGGNQTIKDLSGVTGSQVVLGANSLTVGTANTTAFAGSIEGTGGSLIKVGTGTLILSGINTYTGATTVSVGTLQVDGSLNALSAVTLASGTTLSGSGTVGGTTTANSATVNGNGLTLTGLLTFNGVGNTLGGTETATAGVTVATGATVTQTGTLTGNLTDSGTTTLNGALAGNATVNSGGTLAGSGLVSGTTGVTGGTVNGTGLTLNGLTTFNGAGNTLSGTETATTGVTVATGATVTQTGTLTGNLTDSGTTTLNGTLAGNATVNSGAILAGSGLVSGTTGVTSGTVNGTGLTLNGLTTFNGAGNTLSGTETATSGVMVAAGATVTQTGTLTGNLVTSGTTTLNGALIGSDAVNSGGTLAGSGSVSGTTFVTNGTVNGTGLTLTGLTTFSSGNNTLSGTETATGGVGVATGATVTQTGTLTGNLATSGTTTLNGTLAGNATVNSGGTLAGGGSVTGTTGVTSGTINGSGISLSGLVTFNGSGNTLGGTVTAINGISLVGTAAVSQTGMLTGSVNNASSGNSTFAGVIAGAGSTWTQSGSGTATLSGVNTYGGGTTISGGTLNITGAGRLGSNTSALNIAGGTLDLGATSQTVGAVSFTGSGTVQNGTLTGTSYTSSAVAGTTRVNVVLAGVGSALTQSGAGTLILNNANTYGGGTTISAGTLVVGNAGALGTGAVTQSGGTLVASGTGGSQITVLGDYVQNGGTLVINLSSAASDLLNVTGQATLDGTLSLQFSSAPTKGQVFQVVATTGGITDVGANFSTPVVSPAGYVVTTSETLDGNNFDVTIVSTQFALTAQLGSFYTPNRAAILNYIDSNVTSGPLFTAISTALAGSSLPATAADIADQMNPEKFGNFSRSAIFNNAVFTTQMFDSYFENQRSPQGDFLTGNGQIDSSALRVAGTSMDPALAQIGGQFLAWSPTPLAPGLLSDTTSPVLAGIDTKELRQTTVPNNDHNFSTFIAGNVVLGQNLSQEDLSHSDTTTGAVQIGADYRITPHLRAGALFGYSHTDADLDNNGSKATLDNYAPGVYASYAQSGWYANALGSYGFSNFTEDRHIGLGGFSAVAHGAPGGDQIVGNLDGGYDFHVKNWTFGPLVGVQYTHLDVDSYTESGADALGANLAVSKQEADSLRSRLGGHLSYAFQVNGKVVLTPHLDVSWQHEFMDQGTGLNAQIISAATAGATPFTVKTPNPSRDSALVDCGLTADLNGQVGLFGDYLVQAGQSNYFGQSVEAGVKIDF